ISNDPALAAPYRGFPMMGYQLAKWVSPWEFCKLMDNYGVSCNLNFGKNSTAQDQREKEVMRDPMAFADADKRKALLQATEFIAVGGVVNTQQNTARFSEVARVDNPTLEQRNDAVRQLGYQTAFGIRQNVPFTLVQVDASGNVLASQELFLAAQNGDPAY